MGELILIEKEPNIIEGAIIGWDIPSLKKLILDQNLLYSLGYTLSEIDHMQIIIFGIKIPNPSQMTPFEKAVYANDKKTVESYYRYMNKKESDLERYGYTDDDLKNIRFVNIDGNNRFATSLTDSYEIATRLDILQKNKNKMAEMFLIKYLKEESDLLHKEKAINSLVSIYRQEEYLPERMADFERLVSKYPEMLEYSQLIRSLHIELLYRDDSNEKRYQQICQLGDEYEKQLKLLSEKFERGSISKAERDEESKKYALEEKAKYIYGISKSKADDAWEYFIKNKLYEQTNVTFMKAFLESSKNLLKLYLQLPEKNDGIERSEVEGNIRYPDILHKMAAKARGKRGNANYSFLLYLNREFGSDFGIDWNGLEELYKNADHENRPFEYKGYGTYLYALAEEYIRIHTNLDGFPYRAELSCLKKEFYSYYVKNIENHLLDESLDCERIRYKLILINNCILRGERKLIGEKSYGGVNGIPRYLCFFPEQDQDLYAKYEEAIQKDIEQAKDNNRNRNMLKNLDLSIISSLSNLSPENRDEAIDEICFYLWKKIQLDFDHSKDQWLVLAKVYECYMNKNMELRDKEGSVEEKTDYENLQMEYANKVAHALRIRAELDFAYLDWYDLYQFYFKQAIDAVPTEKMPWIKLAFELYLEIAYKIEDDPDQVGKHFDGLQKYFENNANNYFKVCIKEDKNIAARYIEEFAKLYYQYRQYRYQRFAFEITKVTKDYSLYLKKFLKALVQWEMVQLTCNIHYLLAEKEYEIAQEFYDYCVEHINNIPTVLSQTQELITELRTANKSNNLNIINLLETYPNIKNHHHIVENDNTDESLMLDNIKALEFILKYYISTKELTGELDCSSIRYALYLQYDLIYSKTMNEEYLESVLEALVQAGEEKGYLPYLYKGITLCYRYEGLKQYGDSIVDKMKVSPGVADRLKVYGKQLDNLKISYSNGQDQAFQELCDLTLHYVNSDKSLIDIKEFIKKYILRDKYEMTDDLIDYLMSFDMIDKVWLQLYFEESDEIINGQSLGDYAIGFHPVNKILYILDNSKKSDISVLNLDIVKTCVFKSGRFYTFGQDNPYVMLVKDYLKNNSSSAYEGAELLHHFFASMEKDEGPALYEVIDTINEETQYKNDQCIALFEQLFKETGDFSYLTGLARQYAKARNYVEAEKCYMELLSKTEKNPILAKRYSYIKTHELAISILAMANNNERIELSLVQNEKVSGNEACEALAYIYNKYPDEVTKVMEAMEEEERKLFNYILKILSFEKREDIKKNKRNSNSPLNLDGELEEKDLLGILLSLKDSRYFPILLPNLYQRSDNGDFKYYLEGIKDHNIQRILKETNNKPIIVLLGQNMKRGQRLVYVDYDRQTRNVDVNVSFLEENQDTPLLQEAINSSNNNNGNSISDLFLQLDREKSNHNRKNILLSILAYQPDNPEDIEKDGQLQRRLQISKAELGYLLHLEEFNNKNYERGLQVLHEGIVCLGKNKSDCRSLLEKIRDEYLKVLEVVHNIAFKEASALFPVMIYDMKKIVKILDNDNNYKNVFLRDMYLIISRLQTPENLIKEGSGIGLLETVMESLALLRSDNRYINRITRIWNSWIYSELIRIVNKDTINDIKYFIDRKESNRSLNDFYNEVINSSNYINVYGPRGIGVSSLLKQCYQVYIKDAFDKGNLFLYLDIKEIGNYYDGEDRYGFSKKILEQLKLAILKFNELNSEWGWNVLENIDKSEEVLDCFNMIKRQEGIVQVHLFLDHYEELQEAAKKKIDLLLNYLVLNDIHLVVGSEKAVELKNKQFKEIELAGFAENETVNYIKSRIKYKGNLLKTIQIDKLLSLTGGIPVLLSYMVEYILENKTWSESNGKAYLINKARPLFEQWDTLWMEKLDREDNEAYRSYLMIKNGHYSRDISGEFDEFKAEIGAKIEATDSKIEATDSKVEAAASKLNDMETKLQLISKDIYISKNNLYDKKYINLDSYQKSTNWTQELEVDVAEFSIPSEIWDVIKKEKDVYRYVKYGEALRKELLNMRSDKSKGDYDYSGFALNYCLAFELICHKMLKGFLIEKIPEYDMTKLNKKGISKLSDSRFNTRYTLGNYSYFLEYFKGKCTKEIQEITIGFKIGSFIKDFSDAKDIRNTVAHVGSTLTEEMFRKFLLLLFGSKNKQEGKIPVFEGICRLIKMN